MSSNIRAQLSPDEIIDFATTGYGRVLLDARNVYDDVVADVESSLAEELDSAADVYLAAETDVRADLVRPANLSAQTYANAVQYALSSYQAQLAAAQSRLESAREDLIRYAYAYWRPPSFVQDGTPWNFVLQSIRPFSSQAEAEAYARRLQRSSRVSSTGARVQVDYEPASQTWAVTSWKPSREEPGQPTGRAPFPPSGPADWEDVPIVFRPPLPPADATTTTGTDETVSSGNGDTSVSMPGGSLPVPVLSCPPPTIQVVCGQHCPPVQVPVTVASGSTPSQGGLAGAVPIPTQPYVPAPSGGGLQSPPPSGPEMPPSSPAEGSPYPPGPAEGEEEEEEGEEEVYVAPQPALACSLPGFEPGWEIISVHVGTDRADVSKRSEEAIRLSEKDYPDRAHRYTVVQCGQRYESVVLREVKSDRCPLTEATRPTVTAMPPPHAAITSLLVPGGRYSEDVDVGCDGRVIPLGSDEWRFALTFEYYAKKWLGLWDSVTGASSGSEEE